MVRRLQDMMTVRLGKKTLARAVDEPGEVDDDNEPGDEVPGPGVEEGGEDEGVADDDDGEEDPEEGQLRGLVEEARTLGRHVGTDVQFSEIHSAVPVSSELQ